MEKNITQMNDIEPIQIEKDIEVYYELADNFGEGIPSAYARLAEKLSNNGKQRNCYGIITHVNEKMIYMACLEKMEDDTDIDSTIPLTYISKGQYLSILIENWNKKILEIGPTFDQLIYSGKVDKDSPGIEFYKSETELLCMMISKV